MGVCIDSCHTYAAGFDIKTAAGYERTFRDFDNIVGMKYLKGMHINDSKKGLGSRIDRHESLGKGFLGEEVFRRIINDVRFENIPLILETPDEQLWPQEIKWLYGMQEK